METKLNWLDYSTLTLFMKCPRAYYWRMHKHLQVPGIALHFGKAVHAALAVWNKENSEEKALCIFKEEMKSLIDEDPKRNLTTGIEALKAYFERWKDEAYKTIDVEVGFALDVKASKEDFTFIGKIDRIIESPFLGLGIMEHKTTTIAGEGWLERVDPNLQMEGYITALETIYGERPFGGVLDVIHIHENPKSRKPAIRVLKTKWDSFDWSMNVSSWYDKIYECNKENFHPKNTEACKPIIGYSCAYQELCSLYPNPYILNEIQIPGKYVIEAWHPFEHIEIQGRQCNVI